MPKITVLYPIKVPLGLYCWEYLPPHEICDQLDNEGGHPTCTLGFSQEIGYRGNGVLKPKECLNLKYEVK